MPVESLSLPDPAPRDRAVLTGFALAALALHLLALTAYGWFRDEFYYVACARRLAWGYVDHPPLSIGVLALWQALARDSLGLIRLLPALAHAATVFLTGTLAAGMGGGRFAQCVACLTALLAPVFLGITSFYSMNAFDLLLWTAAALALIEALRGRTRWWLALGAVMGLGLLNKISMAWFGLGLLAGLAATSRRRWLATPWPWAAGAIAVFLFSPHVLWQIRNGWPTLGFMRNAAASKMVAVSPIDFLRGQLVTMGPANALIHLPGLLFALFAPAGRPWRVFGLLFLTVAALLVAAGTSRASYLSGAYPMLLAIGGVAWERWTARARWARVSLLGIVGALGLPLIPLALPLLPPEVFLRYQAVLGMAPSTEERTEVGPFPQHYADRFGWEELVEQVARAYASLPPEERRGAVVFGQNYGEAGAVDVLGRKQGLPRAISGHNSYWLWGPGDWDGGVMIIIGGDAEDNAEWFERVEQVGVWDHPYAMPYERGLGIFIGRGFRYPPRQAWARLRMFL